MQQDHQDETELEYIKQFESDFEISFNMWKKEERERNPQNGQVLESVKSHRDKNMNPAIQKTLGLIQQFFVGMDDSVRSGQMPELPNDTTFIQ